MVNIDRTIILSYPRTGSTALYDIYKTYVSTINKDTYLRIPSEAFTADTWRHEIDYNLSKNSFDPFFEKYQLSDRVKEFVQKNINHDPVLSRDIFESITQEPSFVTKIFPNHILDNPEFMSDKLTLLANDGCNIVCIYRRNLLDSISSMITSMWSGNWVISRTRLPDRQYLVRADEIELPSDRQYFVWYYFEQVKAWYDCYCQIKANGVDVKLIAYEDVVKFDEKLLNDLHGLDIDFQINCLTQVQNHYNPSSTHEQIRIIYKYREMIEAALTEWRDRLPINTLNQVIIPE